MAISIILIPLLTAIFSFLGAFGGGLFVWKLNNNNERYQKPYGPLRFSLLMMKFITTNKEEIFKDIKEWASVDMRIEMMQKHVNPLTLKWIEHSNNIRNLFKENSGLIKKSDFNLVSDFMDGYIKREIIEQGKNVLAIDENRTNKLLEAINGLQEKLL